MDCCESCLFTLLNLVAQSSDRGFLFSQHVARRADPQLPLHSHEYLSWSIPTHGSRC
uniref:Secreted protein n=1 Tax=Mesocestoides corti TaxID=53468 RepID=A0A5K3F7G7_MESCO